MLRIKLAAAREALAEIHRLGPPHDERRTIAFWADEFQTVLARLATEPGQPVRDPASPAVRERPQRGASGQPDEARRVVRYVGPRTLRESTLAAIWTETLGLTRVGVEDDFFELGGY